MRFLFAGMLIGLAIRAALQVPVPLGGILAGGCIALAIIIATRKSRDVI